MPDDLQTLPLTPTTDTPAPPRRRRRRFTFGTSATNPDTHEPTPRTPDEAAGEILDLIRSAQTERATWMEQRIARYAKFRGWLEDKDWPWADASNQHIPIMMANLLRVEAGLFNAVLGMRPIMQGKPMRHEQKELAETIDSLIDHQLFVDFPGEQAIEQYISRFCQDGTVLAFTPYLRDTTRVVDVKVVPRDDIRPLAQAMADYLPPLMSGLTELEMVDDEGYSWRAEVPAARPEDPPTTVTIEVYDRDERSWEVVLAWDAVVFDGPAMLPQALEDVVVPMRCENSQPVTPQNPTGTPWIAHLARVDLNTIRRRIEDGTYDYLTMDDWDAIAAEAQSRTHPDTSTSDEDGLKTQKDLKEGREASWGPEHDQITVVTWYGGWDVNDDGLHEEVILTVLQEPTLLARARYLTEQYPGQPLRRPFAEARFIPVPDQFYGIGLPELMEGMHDFLHVIINQMIDNGTLTNLPFGFYRASSGMKAEPIQIPGPGELLPLDNPAQDIAFPTLPHADQTWGFNMVGLGMQFLERLTQIGAIQSGQVPQGKASALRTVGTTMAILQQGAAMPEQILRRLFFGLRQVWEQFHLLNTKWLPPGKRFLITGKPLTQPEAYGVIQDPGTLAIPLAFDFQATLLNTNKGVVSQALQGLGLALFNPLALQFGTVGPEQFYTWQRDLVQAAQLDPARYLIKPPTLPTGDGPKLTAQEVMLYIMERNQIPPVAPLEPPEQHMEALMKIMQSPEAALLNDAQQVLVKEYLRALVAIIRQQMQAQMLGQAAQEFGAMLGNEGQGQQAATGAVPEMQAEAPSQAEIAGAGTQGPPGSAT